MSHNEDMYNVLGLQKMRSLSSSGLTSNLSLVCKKESTISLFACLPGEDK